MRPSQAEPAAQPGPDDDADAGASLTALPALVARAVVGPVLGRVVDVLPPALPSAHRVFSPGTDRRRRHRATLCLGPWQRWNTVPVLQCSCMAATATGPPDPAATAGPLPAHPAPPAATSSRRDSRLLHPAGPHLYRDSIHERSLTMRPGRPGSRPGGPG